MNTELHEKELNTQSFLEELDRVTSYITLLLLRRNNNNYNKLYSMIVNIPERSEMFHFIMKHKAFTVLELRRELQLTNNQVYHFTNFLTDAGIIVKRNKIHVKSVGRKPHIYSLKDIDFENIRDAKHRYFSHTTSDEQVKLVYQGVEDVVDQLLDRGKLLYHRADIVETIKQVNGKHDEEVFKQSVKILKDHGVKVSH